LSSENSRTKLGDLVTLNLAFPATGATSPMGPENFLARKVLF
jgi:hypothetical protein